MAPKRKCKFNDDWRRDFAWIANLPDNGMAQCDLCVTDVSISSGGRTGVRRHQKSARHAKLVKNMGSTKPSQSLYSSSKGGMVQYVAHGQKELSRRCDKSANDAHSTGSHIIHHWDDPTRHLPTGERWPCCRPRSTVTFDWGRPN